MKTLFLILVTLSLLSLLPVFSDDSCSDCEQSERIPQVIDTSFTNDNTQVLNMMQLSHWGASTSDIKSAPCRVNTSDQVISDYVDSIGANETKQDFEVLGVSLEDESPAMKMVFENLLTKRDFFDEPVEEQLNIQDRYNINPNCKKARCAIKKIFGEKISDKLIYALDKFGLNSSDIAFENSSRISEKQLDIIIRGASNYPPSTFPLEKNKRCNKFKNGYSMGGPRVIANAMITFFDSWNGLESPEMMEYTVYHELAHYNAHELDLDENPDWLSQSGWVKKDEEWEATKPNTFVSLYGKTNPAEDFAESVSTYRYNPDLLKRVSPGKYQFIKENVFQGVEYLNEESCNPPSTYTSQIIQKGIERVSNMSSRELFDNQELLSTILSKCRSNFISVITENTAESIQSSNQCARDGVTTNALIESIDNLNPKPANVDILKERIKLMDVRSLNRPDIQGESAYQLNIRKQLINSMADVLAEEIDSYILPDEKEDKNKFCERKFDHVYLAIERKEGFKELAENYELFSQRDQLSDTFTQACLRLQTDTTVRQTFEPSEIKLALRLSPYSASDIPTLEKILEINRETKRKLQKIIDESSTVVRLINYRTYKEQIEEVDRNIQDAELELRIARRQWE